MSKQYALKNVNIAWNVGDIKGDGVVVGCDVKQEWMLEWWWKHYSKYNDYPVTFANFGMSNKKIDWCSSRGVVIDLSFNINKTWFKKPLAILNTLYNRCIWIDLDCEIRDDISKLFEHAESGIGVTIDPHTAVCKNENPVASGVIVVKHGNPVIVEWAKKCLHLNGYIGDQDVFNDIIKDNRELLSIMPPEYQWLRLDGDKPNVIMMHWTGPRGKDKIRADLGLPSKYRRVRNRVKNRGASNNIGNINNRTRLKRLEKPNPVNIKLNKGIRSSTKPISSIKVKSLKDKYMDNK